MTAKEIKDTVIREFKITTLALKNKNTVFLLAFVILLFGGISYNNLPKELFPDIVIPTILVQTTYPGNAPIDIENLITRPIEKEIEGINGIKTLSSTSAQDASMVFVEFNTNVNIEDALSDVKDAVDNAKRELPNDLMFDPLVMDIDLSEFPILNINLSGDFSLEELRDYAEYLEDEIESISEISKVELQGLNEKEIRIDVDLLKMEALELTFFDIEMAVAAENISISGGEIKLGSARRSIRTIGEFQSIEEIGDIIIKREMGNTVQLKDIADVFDGYADPESYARLNKQPVVSVQVIKKGGENLLAATDKIFETLDQARQSGRIPADLNMTLTNDQSDMVRLQINNLENSMIMGVIFVVLVLFYFLGTRNALFVGIAIPMSMFTSFIILNMIGYKLNMIVLFSLILALGMLVDNGIVVVENIYRFVSKGYKPFEAARQAVGEIAVPIIASTATTLAAFIPLAFWGGMTGEFMKALPITLMIVLSSSLFVALIIIPVISATFIRVGGTEFDSKPDKKKGYRTILILAGAAVLLHIIKWPMLANLMVLFAIIGFLNIVFFHKAELWFQNVFLVWLEKIYTKSLQYALRGRNPLWFFIGTIGLMFFTMILFGIRQPQVTFFPINSPNYINVIAEFPIGTDIEETDRFMKEELEEDVFRLLEPHRDIVKSVLTTVGKGGEEDLSNMSIGGTPHKALTTVTFVDYEFRKGIDTRAIMRVISDELIGKYPGVQLSVEKDNMGPPAGKAINIEISGQDFEELLYLSDSMMTFIDMANIEGVEGLKSNLTVGKPELLVTIDREKARRYGLSTMQIASTIRTSLFGKEISDFKVGEDEYPIQLRLQEKYRYNVPALMNQKIIFNEDGKNIGVPISAVADFTYSSTYGSVRRKNMDRVITVFSNVIEGYNSTEINNLIAERLSNFELPEGYTYSFTGEQQEQQESMAFLGRAMLIALALILLILVTQFNSVIRPAIILASILFSTIGVFGGIATFKMDFVVVMTGIGIISLAGIVVNNAIVLVDYIELLKARKRKELGLEEGSFLPLKLATECIVQGGKTRLRPVLLTAITTILGLLPLAVGLNIDFRGLFAELAPNLYFGGPQAIFWGAMAWTVIFGLTFSTFLTLIIVPVMYRLTTLIQKRMINLLALRKNNNGQKAVAPVE
ncbi:MAG TPA: efflux RND transporter permease subunit [Bacteroides sp.]|nr:efflux RND transporter permease subunit [Bacteroides sp.]